MANYKETTISGTKYQRARLVTITNELNGNNTITFLEEEVCGFDNNVLHADISQLSDTMTPENATVPFNLINPETGDVIGQSTYQQLYLILYGLYTHLATIRDTPPA